MKIDGVSMRKTGELMCMVLNSKQAKEILKEMIARSNYPMIAPFLKQNIVEIMGYRLAVQLESTFADWKKPLNQYNDEELENLAMVLFGLKSKEDKEFWNRK